MLARVRATDNDHVLTAMPSESGSTVGNIDQMAVGSLSVGVTHVVEHCNGEFRRLAGIWRGLEAQSRRGRCTIACSDGVVVSATSFEVV